VYKAIVPAVALLAISSLLAATPAKPHKRRTPVKAGPSTLAQKRPPATTKAAAAKTTSVRTVKANATHRNGKIAYHAAPRYFQQAPTADRYKEIQQALASKGYFQGEPNGSWGADSADALKRFQADQSLMPDGKISSLSLIALGLGPKRLTAKSDTTLPPQGALPGTSPGASTTPPLAPTSPALTPAPAPTPAPPQ
jgi:Putative peptidoglycan binding domain